MQKKICVAILTLFLSSTYVCGIMRRGFPKNVSGWMVRSFGTTTIRFSLKKEVLRDLEQKKFLRGMGLDPSKTAIRQILADKECSVFSFKLGDYDLVVANNIPVLHDSTILQTQCCSDKDGSCYIFIKYVDGTHTVLEEDRQSEDESGFSIPESDFDLPGQVQARLMDFLCNREVIY